MVHKHTLENGVTVLIDEMQDVRSFALGFFVRAGSGEETPGKRGISHFLEHVLFKRTRRRSTVEIARAIDRLGGDVDAFTTKEYTAHARLPVPGSAGPAGRYRPRPRLRLRRH
jgi:predicted Zn-dependent peptidase